MNTEDGVLVWVTAASTRATRTTNGHDFDVVNEAQLQVEDPLAPSTTRPTSSSSSSTTTSSFFLLVFLVTTTVCKL